MRRKGFSILFALVLVISLTMVAAVPVGATGPVTIHLGPGTITSASLGSYGTTWGPANDLWFDLGAGLKVTIVGLNMGQVPYTGAWGWPPVSGEDGGSAQLWVVDGCGRFSRHDLTSAANAGGTWDAQGTRAGHDDGFRKYLIQNFHWPGWDDHGSSQYNVEPWKGPRVAPGPNTGSNMGISNPDSDKFDLEYTYAPSGVDYTVSGRHRMYYAASWDEMSLPKPPWPPYKWQWNKAINNVATPEDAWLPFYQGAWTVPGFCGPANLRMAFQNRGVPQSGYWTISWDDIVIEGTPVEPSEVWVDDDWAGTAPGTKVGEGKFFGYNAFATIQDGIDAVAGSTVHVAAGTYAGAIVDKNVTISGAGGGGSVIASGVPYKIGVSYTTAFRLDAGADGAEISDFTINNNQGASFYFAVYSKGVDDVTIDSLEINDTVQGITNWGGSGWTITNNTIIDTVAAGGGGIAIFLGATPPSYRTCSDNLVQYNTIDASATAETYSCPGICLALDTRYGAYDDLDDSENISGNQILNNTVTASGANNGVGIEVGTILGDSETDPDRTDPVKIAAIMTAAAVHDNTVQDNIVDGADIGIYFYNVANLTITQNTVENSVGYGMYAEHGQSGTVITDNTFTDNEVQLGDETDDTATLDPLDIATILSNNTFDRAVTVDHPGASLLHTIWSSIQDGIDEAGADDTVNVAVGTYDESVTINKNDLTLTGQIGSMPAITGGLKLDTNLAGLTLQNFYVTGTVDPLKNSLVRMYGVITDLTVDNCVFDGENTAGRNGFSGGQIEGDLSVTNSEFKDIVGWAVLDTRSGSGGDGSAMGTVTFASNNVHDCDGSIVFRGLSTDWTDNVYIYGNIFQNIGEEGISDHWAAFEVNRATDVEIHDNEIRNVVECSWGEGQAMQLWKVGIVDIYDNTVENNYMGIAFLKWPGDETYDVSDISIYHNNFSGNDQYALSVEDGLTGGLVDAENNWWGHASGPSGEYGRTNPAGKVIGKGDAVSDNIDWEPWLAHPINLTPHVPVPPGPP